MIVVTGGAGFIGSNIVGGLNADGENNILIIDNLNNSNKFKNLVDLDFADFMDKDDFLKSINSDHFCSGIEAIIHQGACSDTMEYDGRYMMKNNYEYSKKLLHVAIHRKVPYIYASSASVYGLNTTFKEDGKFESPLNIYAYSKLLFDRYVQKLMPRFESTVVGLRYFNVYGPKEQHKGRMASMIHQLYYQLLNTGKAKLFEGSNSYSAGEQKRDFISVKDVVAVNLHFLRGEIIRGVFNIGTGRSRSFNDIASTLIKLMGQGEIEYIPMPDSLKTKYQSFTEADISRLRSSGFTDDMTSLEDGVKFFVESH